MTKQKVDELVCMQQNNIKTTDLMTRVYETK